MSNNKKTVKIIGAILGVLCAAALFMMKPLEGLSPEAMRAMGLILGSIVFLLLEVLETWLVALVLCIAFALFKTVPFNVAFSSFAGTTVWLVIGVLGIGVAISKCGLLKRISLYALKVFPPTYNGVVAALLGVGLVCQPLMPSTSAKESIVAPIAMGLGETLGYEKHSKQLGGLFNALYIGWSIFGSVFISASFLGYLFQGSLPPEVQAQFTWGRWAVANIPYALVLLVGSYFAITWIYKPENPKKISKEFINEQIKALGPVSKNEKIVCVIMAVSLVMWILEKPIGIPAAVTALLCLSAMIIFNLFNASDFNTKMAWTLIVMVGGLVNIANVMGALKITGWIGNMILPVFGNLLNSPYLLTAALVVIMYLVRYIIVEEVALVILITLVLGPAAAKAGINPWIVMIIAYSSCHTWVTKYQNGNMLIAWAAAGGDDVINYKDVLPGAYAFMLINLIALLASVPFWKLLGYIQ